MTLRKVLSFGAAAMLCTGVGCKKDSEKVGTDKAEPAAAAAAAGNTGAAPATESETKATEKPVPETPPPAAVALSKGLAEEGNNAKLVELVAAFESCKLASKNPDWDCREAIKPFNAAVDKTADAGTLFNFLDDEKAHVRLAAASAIASTMLMQGKEGREFGARLAAWAARETEPIMAKSLGTAVLQGDFKDAAYSSAVQGIVATHPVDEIRAAVVANLPVQDWETYFPFLKERMGSEKSPAVRVAIMSSFYLAADEEGACDFFAEFLNDADNKVAAKAAYNIVWTSGDCMAKYDDFNAHFEERAKSGKADFMYLNSAQYMARAKKATDEQKERFLAALKTVVEDTKVAGMGRSTALKTIGEHASDGKAYAKKFVGDAEKFVQDAAKEIVKGK